MAKGLSSSALSIPTRSGTPRLTSGMGGYSGVQSALAARSAYDLARKSSVGYGNRASSGYSGRTIEMQKVGPNSYAPAPGSLESSITSYKGPKASSSRVYSTPSSKKLGAGYQAMKDVISKSGAYSANHRSSYSPTSRGRRNYAADPIARRQSSYQIGKLDGRNKARLTQGLPRESFTQAMHLGAIVSATFEYHSRQIEVVKSETHTIAPGLESHVYAWSVSYSSTDVQVQTLQLSRGKAIELKEGLNLGSLAVAEGSFCRNCGSNSSSGLCSSCAQSIKGIDYFRQERPLLEYLPKQEDRNTIDATNLAGGPNDKEKTI